MTSRVGPRTRIRRRGLSAKPAGEMPLGHCCRRAGMTLLEIVLALSIVILLAAMMAYSVAPGGQRGRFHEGVRRFETLLRILRAQAAQDGRRFQMAFSDFEADTDDADSETIGECGVLWEPDPLGESGQFKPYALSTWSSYVPRDEVRVLACRLIGPSAYRSFAWRRDSEQDDNEEGLQDVMFYPDGSSDSVLIELAPASEDDLLRAAIRLDGLNGTIRTLVISQTELEENRSDIEQGLYDPEAEADEDNDR